ncbi:MAG: hypothetical protein QNK14_00065 [Desulfobacterales bacterium]|nr:hypothetical protein [Desulfobacterales bacterium]
MEPRSKNTPGLILTILVLVAVVFLFSGCVTTSKSYKIVDGRIEFPNYGLSIMRPPENDYEMVKDLGPEELVVWIDKLAGTVIGIMASRSGRSLSYHNITNNYAEYMKGFYQQKKPDVSFEITEEKKYFWNGEYYKAKIIYYGLSPNWRSTTILYLHKADDILYYFDFQDERRGQLTNKMMQSVRFNN